MPVPKKRHSNTRTRTRRANWKLKVLNLAVCPQCKSPILPHHVCKVCGTYNGRMVINMESKEKQGNKKSSQPAKQAQPSGKEEKPKS